MFKCIYNNLKQKNGLGIAIVVLLISEILGIFQNGISNDCYFLLRLGKEIVTNGFPTENFYSNTPGMTIYVQQWSWDVILYGMYSVLGYLGILILGLGIFLLLLHLLYKLGTILCADNNLICSIVVLFGRCLYLFGDGRPQLLTLCLVVAEIIILEEYKINGKGLWKLIIVSLIQINVHASMWPFLFIFILPYIFWSIKNPFINFAKRNYKIKPIIISALGMVAVGFFNPYGLDNMLYLYHSSKGVNAYISELVSPKIMSSEGVIIILLLILTVIVLVKKSDMQFPAEYIYLVAGTCLMAGVQVRNQGLFFIGFFTLLSYSLKNFKFNVNLKITKSFRILMLFLVVLMMIVELPDGIKKLRDCDTEKTTVKAVKYLDQLPKEEIVLYNDFNLSPFLMWNGYNVYINAQTELYTKKLNKKADIWQDYIDIEIKRQKDIGTFIEENNFTHFIVNNDRYMKCHLDARNDLYKKVVEGDGYTMYEVIK